MPDIEKQVLAYIIAGHMSIVSSDVLSLTDERVLEAVDEVEKVIQSQKDKLLVELLEGAETLNNGELDNAHWQGEAVRVSVIKSKLSGGQDEKV